MPDTLGIVQRAAESLYRLAVTQSSGTSRTLSSKPASRSSVDPITGEKYSEIKVPAGDTVFYRAAEAILTEEGGYVREVGGTGRIIPTQRGVTLDAYNAAARKFGWPTYTISQASTPTSLFAKAVTKEKALLVYKHGFWDSLNLDQVSKTHPKTAFGLFDASINSGPGAARVHFKNATGQDYTNILGVLSKYEDRALGNKILDLQQAKREALSARSMRNSKNGKKVGYARFIDGWRNRYRSLKKIIQIFK